MHSTSNNKFSGAKPLHVGWGNYKCIKRETHHKSIEHYSSIMRFFLHYRINYRMDHCMTFSAKRKLRRFFDYACKAARFAHDLDWAIKLFDQ